MNRDLVDLIANAVLYEGYILYPYRPSVKNRQRWTFGGLYPEGFVREQPRGSSDASSFQAECLVRGGADAAVEVVARFLHLTDRTVGAVEPAAARGDGHTAAMAIAPSGPLSSRGSDLVTASATAPSAPLPPPRGRE
jgi:hydrogenase maturation protease